MAKGWQPQKPTFFPGEVQQKRKYLFLSLKFQYVSWLLTDSDGESHAHPRKDYCGCRAIPAHQALPWKEGQTLTQSELQWILREGAEKK